MYIFDITKPEKGFGSLMPSFSGLSVFHGPAPYKRASAISLFKKNTEVNRSVLGLQLANSAFYVSEEGNRP